MTINHITKAAFLALTVAAVSACSQPASNAKPLLKPHLRFRFIARLWLTGNAREMKRPVCVPTRR